MVTPILVSSVSLAQSDKKKVFVLTEPVRPCYGMVVAKWSLYYDGTVDDLMSVSSLPSYVATTVWYGAIPHTCTNLREKGELSAGIP